LLFFGYGRSSFIQLQNPVTTNFLHRNKPASLTDQPADRNSQPSAHGYLYCYAVRYTDNHSHRNRNANAGTNAQGSHGFGDY